MLTIRREQRLAFAQPMLRNFEERALAHLRETIPEDYARVGDEAARQSIHTALHESKQYGFTTEFEVLTYLNLMYLLGFEFDQDPALPWVRRILTDERLGASAKIARLLRHFKGEEDVS
jgi:hypothetical protein